MYSQFLRLNAKAHRYPEYTRNVKRTPRTIELLDFEESVQTSDWILFHELCLVWIRKEAASSPVILTSKASSRERGFYNDKKKHTKSYCNDKRRLFGLQMTPNSLLWFSIAFYIEENINWTLIVWWPKFNIYNKDFVLAICYLSDFISITILIIVCESFYTQTPTSIVFPLKVLIELNALIWILLCKSSTRSKLI